MQKGKSKDLLLSGRIVFPDGGARQRYIFVRDGRIKWISRSRPPSGLVGDAREITTGPQDWIFPGLIDLHTHATYNFIPIWRSTEAPFRNRFEWQALDSYRTEIRDLHNAHRRKKFVRVLSELQAVAGGTTSLQEDNKLEEDTGDGTHLVLCRDIEVPSNLDLPNGKRINSEVFFFRETNGVPTPVKYGDDPTKIAQYAAQRDSGELAALLLHLAEGRSGFGSDRGVDPYSRREFEAFMALPELQDAAKVRSAPLSIVHGCGIDVTDRRHIEFLLERNISIVWSPASNMLLYDDTIDAGTLFDAGVNVVIGSDWSPSGSKHVWDEAKFARFFLAAIGSTVSDADVFRMVTANNGRALGLPKFGLLQEDAFADFFILRSPIESDNPLEIFFSTTDRDVLATIIAGRPIYGTRNFLKQFKLELQGLPRREGSAVRGKAVHLPSTLEIELNQAANELEDAMKARNPHLTRSNLLASSDKLYQRSMQMLRARTERFGWSVRQWRKDRTRGKPSTPGRIPVPPSCVKLRCGFMAGDDHDAFRARLGATLLPSAAGLLGPIGLTTYLSAVPERTRPESCPDEVALIAFERDAGEGTVGKRLDARTGGRAYGLLRQQLFRFGQGETWSDFAARYSGRLVVGKAYFLIDREIDWHQGEIRLFLGARRNGQSPAEFLDGLRKICDRLLAAPPAALDGALVAVAEHYVVFWDHAEQTRTGPSPHLDALAAHASTVMRTLARSVNSQAGMFARWPGVAIEAGDCLRLRFQRRALFPW